MEINLKKLTDGLEVLTGKDLEDLEKTARALRETMPEITLSKKYQALVAAKVLGVKYDDITDLPARKYLNVTMTVFNFFYEDMASESEREEKTPEASEARQDITEE